MSATLRITCPNCSAVYQIGSDRSGKRVKCRSCAQSWTVTDPASSESPVNPPSRATKVASRAVATEVTPAATAVKKASRKPPVEPPPAKSRRGPILGAAVAAVVLLVGITLWALSGGKPAKEPMAAISPKPLPAPAVQAAKPLPPAKAAEPARAPTPIAATPVPVAPPAPAPAVKGKKAAGVQETLEAEAFFKTPKVVEISIEIAPEEYAALKREPRKYVRATLKEGDKTWKDVALHLKGAAGSFRDIDDKPGFSLNMDKWVEDQDFHGLDKFHLNNCVQDPSFVSELICGEIFRSVGVPAARCAHAIVTVNGKRKGFYLLKEGYDTKFLDRNFGTKKGNLYDGGFLRDLDQELQIISDKNDVKPYTELKALIAAAQLPDPVKRHAELERLLDADRWVSYLALEVLMFDWDGYPMKQNNYRLYHDPKRDKITFIPSGTDQMFGDPNGTLLPQFGGLIARAYVATPEGRTRFLTRMDEILKNSWKPEVWNKRLDEIEAVLKPALAKVDANHAKDLPAHIKRLRDAFAQRLVSAQPNLKRLLNPTPPKNVAGGPGLPDDGFLRKYLFLGPIATQGIPGAQALQKDFLEGEAKIKPATGTKTKTPAGELVWKGIDAMDGMVDFHAASGRQADGSACYLAAYLVCEKDFKDLKLKMGSDDQGKVWINGKDVLRFEGDRAAAPDQDNADNIALNKGVNTILFKVVNGSGGFQGILRFTNADGTPFMDARLSMTPDGK
ncbi:MAG TPA: CotH kinase family protein [Planctomycetota bacterium]|nr:CotH kinase family protein [Planctomycetota bacterium]